MLEVTFEEAREEDEYARARLLVGKVYAREGYISAPDVNDTSELAGFIGLPTSKTINAYLGNDIVGTISLVLDSTLGFPMDALYAEELSPYRTQDNVLAEVCQFAIDRESSLKTHAQVTELELALGLFSEILVCAYASKCTHVCFAINPKHTAFYESIGARRIGDEKMYSSVNNAPAYGYLLDLKEFKEDKHSFLKKKILDMIADHE